MSTASVISHLLDGIDENNLEGIQFYAQVLRVDPVKKEDLQSTDIIPWKFNAIISDGTNSMYALLTPKTSDILSAYDLPTWVHIRSLTVAMFARPRVYVIEDLARTYQWTVTEDISSHIPLNCLQDIDCVCAAILHRRQSVEKILQTIPALEVGNDREVFRERNESLQDSLHKIKQRSKVKIGRLQENLDALSAEVEMLKAALRAKDSLLEKVNTERRPRAELPFELWQTIFRCALPPEHLADIILATPIRRVRIESIGLLKSVVRVCKLWHAAGTQLLYGHVCIDHIGHLAALVCALESAVARGDDYGRFITLISLDFWEPKGCEDMVTHDLEALAGMCPRLLGLVLGPKTLGVDSGYPEQISRWMPRSFHVASGQLQRLGVFHRQPEGFPQSSEWLGTLLSACCNLVQLDLLLETDHITWPDIPYDLNFDRVEHLRLGIMCGNLFHAISYWKLPVLQTLTLLSCRQQVPLEMYLPFVNNNGQRIKYLDIRPDTRHNYSTEKLQWFLDACPALQHLCYTYPHNGFGLVTDPNVHHKTLAYVDTWTQYAGTLLPVLGGDALKGENSPGLPALVRCRALDGVLAGIPDLPLLLPPQKMLAERLVVHRILGLDIIEGPRSVFIHGGMLWEDEDGNWSEQPDRSVLSVNVAPSFEYGDWALDPDDLGSSYDPGSSVCSSEWDSDRDISYPDSETEAEAQITRQEVLERYRETKRHSEILL